MKINLRLQAYTPRTHQFFWCKVCDHRQVDSNQPETGTFHVIHGHSFDRERQEYAGEYLGVMFAVCKVCAQYAE